MENIINFFWFRRDLRLEDNVGLLQALKSGKPVQPLFIFDTTILDKLEDKNDRRVVFIHSQLIKLNDELKKTGSCLLIENGEPLDIWKKMLREFQIENVYTNQDYEPYARNRDEAVLQLLKSKNIGFHSFKDQVIFEKDDIDKDDGSPYTVFTPYMNKWKKTINESHLNHFNTKKYFNNFLKKIFQPIPSLKKFGFNEMKIYFPTNDPDISLLNK